jgi:hypothetical protein
MAVLRRPLEKESAMSLMALLIPSRVLTRFLTRPELLTRV